MITGCTYIHVYYFEFYIHIETLQPLHKSWYASNLISYYNGYFCCLELWKRATIGRHIAMSAQNIRQEILSYFRRPYNTPVFISMKNSYVFLHLTFVFVWDIWGVYHTPCFCLRHSMSIPYPLFLSETFDEYTINLAFWWDIRGVYHTPCFCLGHSRSIP
jgi:hypothetical protein